MRRPPPFTPDATCPKCGHGGITSQYQSHSTVSLSLYGPDVYDWLRRSCTLCGYSWYEACRDAEALASAARASGAGESGGG
jgi:hypothetical protein